MTDLDFVFGILVLLFMVGIIALILLCLCRPQEKPSAHDELLKDYRATDWWRNGEDPPDYAQMEDLYD